MIRAYHPIIDQSRVNNIHAKHYADFELPDFNQFQSAAIVDGIVIGGFRPIAEVIILTDKDASVRKRMMALREFWGFARYAINSLGYPDLFCMSQDPVYTQQLIRNGFNLREGEALGWNHGK